MLTHDLLPAVSTSGRCTPDSSKQTACTQLFWFTYYECIVTARVVSLATRKDLQERKTKICYSFAWQDPGCSLQVEPWCGKRTKSCAIRARWLAAYWVNADFNSLKAARRCFLSSSSRFRSSCSALISASNLLAEERAWTFTKEKTNTLHQR